MRERPILFSAPMVRAILDEKKTQTRRAAKLTDSGRVRLGHRNWHLDDPEATMACPYGQPGDRLWVREAWAVDTELTRVRRATEDAIPDWGHGPYFRADSVHKDSGLRWRPSIHLPRWASRIDLEIADIRVERLQEISEEDSIAEGCSDFSYSIPGEARSPIKGLDMRWARHRYATLWEEINGPGSWSANPWVWVVEFLRIRP